MMRLRELDAEFIGKWRIEDGHVHYTRLDSIDGAQGISFQCPLCSKGKERAPDGGFKGAHYVLCWFRNPRGADRVPDNADPGPGRWWAEGSSIDDLTFTHGTPPMAKSVQLNGGCNWHGFVENGAAA